MVRWLLPGLFRLYLNFSGFRSLFRLLGSQECLLHDNVLDIRVILKYLTDERAPPDHPAPVVCDGGRKRQFDRPVGDGDADIGPAGVEFDQAADLLDLVLDLLEDRVGVLDRKSVV